MTTPDDTNEARGASSGTTRTPPPRTRRGAPATRTGTTSFDDALDNLDELLVTGDGPPGQLEWANPEEPAARDGVGGGSTTPARPGSRSRGAKPDRPAAVVATTAAIEDFGDPVEPEIAFEPAPVKRPPKARAAKRPERRFRQTVQKVDLWSVTKMALCFYVSAMGVIVVSLVALWVVADSAGIINNVENFIGDLFSSEDFHFVSGQVLRGAVLVGVVLVALLVAFTIIAASFYNIFAELFGGIEIVIREEEQPPKR